MKKKFIILAMSLMVAFTACNDSNYSENKIQRKCYKVAMQYAKNNNFDMDGYKKEYFQVFKSYNIESILETYENQFMAKQYDYMKLMYNESSIFYRPAYDIYEIWYMMMNIKSAYESNDIFIGEDLLMIRFLNDWMTDFYKELDESSKQVIGYKGVWAYSISNKGVLEDKKYIVEIPCLKDFNMDFVEITECNKDDYTLDNEEMISIMKMCLEFPNPIGYKNVNELIQDKEKYSEYIKITEKILHKNNML